MLKIRERKTFQICGKMFFRLKVVLVICGFICNFVMSLTFCEDCVFCGFMGKMQSFSIDFVRLPLARLSFALPRCFIFSLLSEMLENASDCVTWVFDTPGDPVCHLIMLPTEVFEGLTPGCGPTSNFLLRSLLMPSSQSSM